MQAQDLKGLRLAYKLKEQVPHPRESRRNYKNTLSVACSKTNEESSTRELLKSLLARPGKGNILSKLEKLVGMYQDEISSLQSTVNTLEEKVALQLPTPKTSIRRPAISPEPATRNQVGGTDSEEITNLEINAGNMLATI
jgi:hypothetical protein